MACPRANTPVSPHAHEPVPPMLVCARGGFILVIVLAVAAQVCVHCMPWVAGETLVVEVPPAAASGVVRQAPSQEGNTTQTPHCHAAPSAGRAEDAARMHPQAAPYVASMLLMENWSAVFAAVIGVAGYIGDHITARKAEARQAKLERVVAQAHEFLTPMVTQGHGGFYSLQAFLTQVERRHADIWPADLLDAMTPAAWDWVTGEGDMNVERAIAIGRSSVYSMKVWVWLMTRSVFVWEGRPRAVFTADNELPEKLVALLEAELAAARGGRPTSWLWTRYERFVRVEWVPVMEVLERLVTDHGDLMEPLDEGFLRGSFGRTGLPRQNFQRLPRMALYSMLLSYARGWRAQVDEWDAGIYHAVRPPVAYPVGFLMYTVEGSTRVAAQEKALVGSSQQHGSGPSAAS